jgi:hypothetical protein
MHMSMRVGSRVAAAAATLLAIAGPASAQQTLNVSVGYFMVHGEDARVDRDVLNEHRNFLEFEVDDFSGPVVGAEWLIPLGGFVEAGAGLGFSRRSVSSVYSDFVDSDGTEIDQDLRLRLIPIAFTMRLLPTGQRAPVQPYVGGGLGIVSWRYSESGEFVDTLNRNAIFRDQYVDSGAATGPVVLGGIRFAGDAFAAGFEVRYQRADAELDGGFTRLNEDLIIDVGGWSYLFTAGWRFGQ